MPSDELADKTNVELEALIDQEYELWRKAGMNPNNVNADTLTMGFRVDAIIDVIRDRMEVTDEQLNWYYMKNALEGLRRIRVDLEQSKQEAEREAIRRGIMHGIVPNNRRPPRIH